MKYLKKDKASATALFVSVFAFLACMGFVLINNGKIADATALVKEGKPVTGQVYEARESVKTKTARLYYRYTAESQILEGVSVVEHKREFYPTTVELYYLPGKPSVHATDPQAYLAQAESGQSVIALVVLSAVLAVGIYIRAIRRGRMHEI